MDLTKDLNDSKIPLVRKLNHLENHLIEFFHLLEFDSIRENDGN